MARSEFTVADTHHYNRTGPRRWIWSHVMRYPHLPIIMILSSLVSTSLNSYSRLLYGSVFSWLQGPNPVVSELLRLVLLVAGARLGDGLIGMGRRASAEFLAQALERDCRDELYVDLLGKSLTFHGRQRVGDLMARATNDVRAVNLLASPGISLIIESAMSVIVPLIAIATIRLELLLVPVLFVIGFVWALRRYTQRLNPVSDAIREQFGQMNAGLEEAISGIEVVKVNAQEKGHLARFTSDARRYRDLSVQQGDIQARYVPLLLYAISFGLALLHALLVYMRQDGFSLGDVVGYMAVFSVLQFPTFLSIFSFSLVQMGISGAARILEVLNQTTDLDENASGHEAPIRGDIVFQDVTFGYEPDNPVLKNVTFEARPGETIAIVGATGSGKSSLTRLINRVYDVDHGCVLVDGVDVRDWNLESLRSQVAAIEQDVFLFSRPIGENIAFGVGQQATQADIERAARQAQADGFITGFTDGYDTAVGERGVTLSGGQRQRIAIARAILANPRILILDDSTSAIDSATEDDIQRAMYQVQAGRTTFLITHRLSQIRWADRVLVMQNGAIVDQGTHDELLARSSEYQRIFGAKGA